MRTGKFYNQSILPIRRYILFGGQREMHLDRLLLCFS